MNAKHKLHLAAALLLALLPWAAAQAAGNIISEDFTGDTTNNTWIAKNGACLTAGDANSINNGGIPACSGLSYYSGALPQIGMASGGDTVGSGALRLTNGGSQGVNENGAIFSTVPFSSKAGLQVTFTTYTYGGNGDNTHGADGIGFYLLDPSVATSLSLSTAANLGAFGGSLGYSCSNANSPHDGMIGAYLGLGIDEFGNFSNGATFYSGGGLRNANDNTASGKGLNTQNPGEIAVRGYGDVNWKWLNANYGTYYPSSMTKDQQQAAVKATCEYGKVWNSSTSKPTSTAVPDYPYIFGYTLPSTQHLYSQENSSTATRTKATPITYQLIIDPDGQLTLAYDYGNTGSFSPLISQSDNLFITTSNGPLPSQFLFGFGASTGGGSNVHEITCFEASPAARTTGAPFVPIHIAPSGSYAYTLSSNPSPVQGLVQSYAVQSGGTPATSDSWEAGALMSTYRSATPVATSGTHAADPRLYSTASDGVTVTPFPALDTAAFNLSLNSSSVPTNACLGTDSATAVGNIINYTVNPSYTWSSMPGSCASYLGPRLSGSYLSTFAQDDYGLVLSPPSTVADLTLPGYASWAAGLSSRPSALLFTNDDGFLYSVDATSGTMNWGWMPRSFVAGLQNYSSFPYQDNFGGKFAAVDAYDGSNWATYVVGSAQNGALWYDLKLSSSGSAAAAPSAVLPITLPSGLAGATYPSANYTQGGVAPTIQEGPSVKTIGTRQYAAFLVNTGSGSSTTSYLVEFDISQGIATAPSIGSAYVAKIPTASIGGSGHYASSNLYFDPDSQTLTFGTNQGGLYQMAFTGNANTDVGLIASLGSSSDTTDPLLWVGGATINGYPYTWAASMNEIDVFGIGGTGWQALWEATNSASSTSDNVTTLTGDSVISDMPAVINGILVVPAYVPPTAGARACNMNGNGFQDYFTLAKGTFPKNEITDSNGNTITSDTALGLGQAYTINVASSSKGHLGFSGTSSSGVPGSALVFQGGSTNQVVQWRVH